MSTPTPMLSRLDLVRVQDVMHRGIVGCDPDLGLPALARRFAEHRIHCVVVHGIEQAPGGERLSWGVVGDHDLVAALAAASPSTAGTLSTSAPETIELTDTLDRVAAIMAAHRITHVVVVEDDYPVGVVSALDLAGAAGGA